MWKLFKSLRMNFKTWNHGRICVSLGWHIFQRRVITKKNLYNPPSLLPKNHTCAYSFKWILILHLFIWLGWTCWRLSFSWRVSAQFQRQKPFKNQVLWRAPVYDHSRFCDHCSSLTLRLSFLPQEQDWRATISSLLDSLLWMTLGGEMKELEWQK